MRRQHHKISRALLVSFSQHYYWFKPAIVEVFLALSFNTVCAYLSNQSNRFESPGTSWDIIWLMCNGAITDSNLFVNLSEPYSIAEDITVDVLVRLYLRLSDDLGEAPGQRRSQNTTFYCRQLFAECKRKLRLWLTRWGKRKAVNPCLYSQLCANDSEGTHFLHPINDRDRFPMNHDTVINKIYVEIRVKQELSQVLFNSWMNDSFALQHCNTFGQSFVTHFVNKSVHCQNELSIFEGFDL